MSLRAAIISVALLWVRQATAQGSSVLLPSSSQISAESPRVQTYAGTIDCTVFPARSEPSVTVVLLTDTLSSNALDDAKKIVLSLYGSRQRSIRIATLHRGDLEVVGPFTNRVGLQNALKEVQAPTADAVVPISATAFFDAISTNAAHLGTHWSRALLIGALPSLDPSVFDYAGAVLLRAFVAQQVRVSWLAPDGVGDQWLPLFQSTGGTIAHGEANDLARLLAEEAGKSFSLVGWTPPPPSSGFVVFKATVSDQQGETLLEVPDLALTEGESLPSIERYAEMQSNVGEAAAVLNESPATEANLQRVRDELIAALAVNSSDPSVLRVAIALYEKAGDYVTAARFATTLVEVRPQDGTAYAALGHALLLGSDLDKAEIALKRVSDLQGPTVQAAEDLARVHIARKDDHGALPFLDQALGIDAKRQDLWFLEGQLAERTKDSSLAIHSFERGLALGGVHIPETASLIRLYLSTSQNNKAVELARQRIADLPPDPAVREEFSATLDDLRQDREALAAWRRVLEVEPDSPRAHYRIARLLFESGDNQAAEQAAEEGLAVAPKFANLYIVKADVLEKQGRMYEARNTLQQGATVAPDSILLSRLAVDEDTYGGSAAEAYVRLVESLGPSSPERLQALERGFAVALRDGDLKNAQSFAAQLKSAAHPEFRGLIGGEEHGDSGSIVPGGLDALAFAAHANEGISPERFFAEYSRLVIDQACFHSPCSPNAFAAEIEEHFQRIAALESLGKRDGNRVVIQLSLNGKEARRNTEKVLALLGIKLRSSKGEVELQRGEKKNQGEKQQTVAALALDEVGIQEALQAGKPYDLEIHDEWAPMNPNEKLWHDTFYPADNAPGGFAAALLRMPKMARLYVGVSSMDRKAVAGLLGTVGLKNIYDRYADLFYLYAPAFALQGTHAAVPGGTRAEPIWAHLAGASPDRPGEFFRALLQREDGRLLGFFFTLSQLDPPHQTFFTAAISRTTEFYKLFTTSEEAQERRSGSIRDSSFTEFLRSVPLDKEGHVAFPGSAEVWTVAKGGSSSETKTANLLKKVSKAAAPGVEDEVLIHLAQTRYRAKDIHHTELDNFLAVSRIDAHRNEHLDEESALLLAQRYGDTSAAYTYFTDLTSLDVGSFHQFLAAVDRIKPHPWLDANLQLGQLHSLIEWICLLKRRHVLGDAEASKLFRYVVDRFASAEGDAGYTSASLESARAILVYCKQGAEADSPDSDIRWCLLGASARAGTNPTIAFRRVLDLQMAPGLDGVFSLYDATIKLGNLGLPTGEIAAMQKAAADLPSVDLPKGIKVAGEEKELILRYDPAPIRKLIEQLSQKAAKRKPNPKELEKLCLELVGKLEPQVALSLAGPIYAYFLRPADLIVSDDPLLLRKHHYFDFESATEHSQMIPQSDFNPTSEGAGSYFTGGFAQFGLSTGTAAGVGWKSGGHGADKAIAAEIAAIRSATWDRLKESDQRLVSLRITVAREWIFESTRRPDEFRTLGEETMGLLSLSRRADLLNGIESRNWREVWDSVTLPDLFALGGKYLERYKTNPWSSPATDGLRHVAADNDGSRLSILGAIPYHSFGCGHTHLLADAPYEEYERYMFPEAIAERSAEFKLFLAVRADSLGVEPSALGGVAEVLAAKAFRAAQMRDFRDWRSLLAAYASVTTGDLKQALEP
jgi:tetratricopeptide (TPR) repeat protein